MQYLLLIYDEESALTRMSADQHGQMMKDYGAFTEELQAAGRMLAGDALDSVSTATSVRVREGKTLTTDGPFAETKEQLGGYYLIEADDLDEAMGWAAKIPSAKWGTVEVRPIFDFSKLQG